MTVYSLVGYKCSMEQLAVPKSQVVAILGDVVSSRKHPDQEEMLKDLAQTLNWTNQRVDSIQPLQVTIGDECQGVYPNLASALRAMLLVRLHLFGRVELRFGIGWGEIIVPVPEEIPLGQSGSAWWNARSALEEIKHATRRQRWPSGSRCRISGVPMPLLGALNAFLLCQDGILVRMDEPDARITLGMFLGQNQVDMARELGISQPSVSKRLVRNGASFLFRAHESLEESIPCSVLA